MRLCFVSIVTVSTLGLCGMIEGCREPEQSPILPDSLPGFQVLRVPRAPTLQLGAIDADPPEHFVDVRSAVRFSDGRVAVAESSTDEIRVFSQEGIHLGNWGRPGSGPCEYRGLDALHLLPGDTLLARDLEGRRVVLFSPSGDCLGTHPETERLAYLAGALPGPLFVRYRDFSDGSDGVSTAPDFYVVLQAPEGDTVATVGPFPGTTNFSLNEERRHVTLAAPFFPQSLPAVGAANLFVGVTTDRSIQVFDGLGSLRGRIPLPFLRRPVRDADFDEVRRRWASLHDVWWWEAFDTFLEQGQFPDSLPYFSQLMADLGDGVWIREYPLAADSVQRWWRIGSDGKPTSLALIPEQLRQLLQITEDGALCRRWGSYDEPIIEWYRFEPKDEGSG